MQNDWLVEVRGPAIFAGAFAVTLAGSHYAALDWFGCLARGKYQTAGGQWLDELWGIIPFVVVVTVAYVLEWCVLQGIVCFGRVNLNRVGVHAGCGAAAAILQSGIFVWGFRYDRLAPPALPWIGMVIAPLIALCVATVIIVAPLAGRRQ